MDKPELKVSFFNSFFLYYRASASWNWTNRPFKERTLFCRLFVGIEPTGTKPKPLTTNHKVSFYFFVIFLLFFYYYFFYSFFFFCCFFVLLFSLLTDFFL